jgi:hypothetical protein
MTAQTLNASCPNRIPLSYVPDVHYQPGSIPVVTVAQLLEHATEQPSDYDCGFAAGIRWATELADFLEFDAMEAASTWPTLDVPLFVRGFVFGVRAAWDDLGGACFVRPA